MTSLATYFVKTINFLYCNLSIQIVSILQNFDMYIFMYYFMPYFNVMLSISHFLSACDK